MGYINVKLTRQQADALLTAAVAMLAGQEGDGDFLCRADVLDRAADAIGHALAKSALTGRIATTKASNQREIEEEKKERGKEKKR